MAVRQAPTMEPITLTGAALRAWRTLAGFTTQQMAADHLGVPLRTYIRWEHGNLIRHPRLLALAMAAIHEGVPPWRTPPDLLIDDAPRRGRPRKAVVI